MLLYALGLFLFLLAYLLYAWVAIPKKKMAHYAKIFRDHGYKVAELPFVPYSAPFYDQLFKEQQTKNDAYYTHKRDYTSVDVLIGNMLNRPNIVLINPKMIQEIMRPQKVSILPKEKSIAEVFFNLTKRGLLALEGPEWKHRRKVLSNTFTHQFLTSQIPLMTAVADQVFDQFEKQHLKENSEKNQKMMKVDLIDMMVLYTSSVVISGFLGMDALKEKLKGQSIAAAHLKLIIMGMMTLKDPLVLIFGQKLVQRRWRQCDRQLLTLNDDINDILKSYIDKFRAQTHNKADQQKTPENIVQLLLQDRKKTQTDQSQHKITDKDIIDDIKTFVIAGTDTTSNFMTAMFLYINEKPSTVQRLTEQINSVIKNDEDITAENIKKLPYLDCCIAETSRMINSATGLFQRQLIEDTLIGGVPISKGTLIDTSFIPALYDPNTFEQPLEFIPERWEKEEKKTEYQQLISVIFSGGPRSCMGKNLAHIEMKVMTIKFLKRYKNLIEHGWNQGRGYDLKLVYCVKDSSVTLTKIQ